MDTETQGAQTQDAVPVDEYAGIQSATATDLMGGMADDPKATPDAQGEEQSAPEPTADDTAGDDNDSPGGEEVRPDADDTLPALDDDLLQDALALGLSEEDAKQLHAAGMLEKQVGLMDRLFVDSQRQDPDPTQAQPKPGAEAGDDAGPKPFDVEQTLAGFMEDGQADPSKFADALKGMNSHYHEQTVQMHTEMTQMRDALGAAIGMIQDREAQDFTRQIDDCFAKAAEDCGDFYGKGTVFDLDAKSTEMARRNEVAELVGLMQERYPNESVPALFRRAQRAAHPDAADKAIQRKAREHARDEQGRFAPRPNPPTEGGKPKDNDAEAGKWLEEQFPDHFGD